jgi:hypothetical protein
MSAIATDAPTLEPAAQAFAEATANPPFLFELTLAEGRKAFDDVQMGDIAKPAIDEEWVTIPGGPTGEVAARIIRPPGATGTLPALLYIHGGGWVVGNAHTHDRLVRELAVGIGAAVGFPEYDRAPEARYPIAIEQSYTVAQWVVDEGSSKGLDASRYAIAGDSVGGNMTAAMTLLAEDRGGASPLLTLLLGVERDRGLFADRHVPDRRRASGCTGCRRSSVPGRASIVEALRRAAYSRCAPRLRAPVATAEPRSATHRSHARTVPVRRVPREDG